MASSFISYVFDRVFRLQTELELAGFESVLLNDIATIFYGLPRTINEIRVLVSEGDMDTLSQALSNVLALHAFKNSIRDSLEKQGSVALNPVTLPITYVVVAKNDYLRKILLSKKKIRVRGYVFTVPSVEAYISYLIRLNQYPYTVDGITLLILWADKLDKKELVGYELDYKSVCPIIGELVERTRVFYEVKEIIERVYEEICGIDKE